MEEYCCQSWDRTEPKKFNLYFNEVGKNSGVGGHLKKKHGGLSSKDKPNTSLLH